MAEIDRAKTHEELLELARMQAEMLEQYEEVVATSSLRMRTILTNLPLSLVILNTSGVIEAVNNKMLELFGYETGDIINLPVSILFEQNDMLENHQRNESTAIHKSGKKFPCQTSRCDVSMGDETKIFLHIKDLTEEHQLKEMRREFLKMVSHDVRNPLTSILGFLDMLKEGSYGELPQKAEKACIRTRETTKRLIDLVTDLLDSEKLESMNPDLKP